MSKKIYIASDHAGFELKEKVKNYLKDKNIEIEDLGTNNIDSVDYPDYAFKLGKKVASEENSLGILICGTGIGMCIAANKVKGIRAAHCNIEKEAEMTRKHNNANVLCLGARIIDYDLATKIVDRFLGSEFEGGRHKDRVNKINNYK